MAEKIGKAVLELTTDGTAFFGGLDKAEARVGGFGKTLDKFGKDAKSVGLGLSAALTAPILGIGAALITVGTQFDTAVKSISASTGATGNDLKALGESFRRVWASGAEGADVVADVLGDLARRTGLTGPPLEALSRQLLNLADITSTQVAPLVASTTRMFGDWAIATDKQGTSLDFLFKASQATGIGVDELSAKLVQFGAPLRIMNFSFEESVALLGKWEKEGVNTELVLGSLRIAAGKFADGNIPMRQGLEAVIAKIQELGPGAASTSLAMETFGKRAGADMAAAVLEGRFAIGDLMTTLQASTATINDTDANTEDLAEKFGTLKNSVSAALAPVGVQLVQACERLIPFLTSMGEKIASVAEWFSKLGPEAKTATLVIAGTGAAIGPALIVFGSLVQGIGGVIKAYTALAATSTATAATITRAATIARTAWLSMLGPAALVAGAVVLIKEVTEPYGFAVKLTNEEIRKQIVAFKASGNAAAFLKAQHLETVLAQREQAAATTAVTEPTKALTTALAEQGARLPPITLKTKAQTEAAKAEAAAEAEWIQSTTKANEGLAFMWGRLQAVIPNIQSMNVAMSEGIPPLESFSHGTDLMALSIHAVTPALTNMGVVSKGTAQAIVPPWRESLADLSESLGQLGDIGGSTMSGLARSVGTVISSLNTTLGSVTSLKSGFGAMTSGGGLSSILGGLSGIVGGIGGIVAAASAAVAGIRALFNAFKSEETKLVNTPRDQFFGQFGGFEGLATQLNAVTGSWEQGSEPLIRALFDADTEAEFKSAQAAIAALLPGIQSFATGGIAMRPLIGQIAEAGPEAIVPLDRWEAQIGSSNSGLEQRMDRVVDGLNALRREFRLLPDQLMAAALTRV